MCSIKKNVTTLAITKASQVRQTQDLNEGSLIAHRPGKMSSFNESVSSLIQWHIDLNEGIVY